MSASARATTKLTSVLPDVLQVPVEMVDFTFKLRDCPFMEFHSDLDRNASTVYDLMYTVAKHHGYTIEADKVQIYIKVSDEEFRPITELTKKLSDIEPVNVFYYNFDPVDGSLLIIPAKK